MSLLLDIIILAVFGLCIYSGYKRGFILSIMSIAVFILSLAGAIKFTPMLADYLSRSFISEKVTTNVAESLTSITGGTDSLDISKLFSEKPEAFTKIIDRFNVNFDSLEDYYNSLSGTSGEITQKVASYIADPISALISKAAAFAIIFFGLLIVLTVIMHIINLVCHIPVLKQMNEFLGILGGAVKGGLYVWGLSLIFVNLMPHLSKLHPGIIPVSVIDNTVIVRFLGSLQILNLFK